MGSSGRCPDGRGRRTGAHAARCRRFESASRHPSDALVFVWADEHPSSAQPTGIFGYLPVSRQVARPDSAAKGSAKCQQTRAVSLGSAWRVRSIATRVKIVLSFEPRVSPSLEFPCGARPSPGYDNPRTLQPNLNAVYRAGSTPAAPATSWRCLRLLREAVAR